MDAQNADDSQLEIGLERSVEINGWSWSAEGNFVQDLVSSPNERFRSRSLNFDLGLDIDTEEPGSLALEAGLGFFEGRNARSLSFANATAVVTYDLQF